MLLHLLPSIDFVINLLELFVSVSSDIQYLHHVHATVRPLLFDQSSYQEMYIVSDIYDVVGIDFICTAFIVLQCLYQVMRTLLSPAMLIAQLDMYIMYMYVHFVHVRVFV